jgi:hypothetical protein
LGPWSCWGCASRRILRVVSLQRLSAAHHPTAQVALCRCGPLQSCWGACHLPSAWKLRHLISGYPMNEASHRIPRTRTRATVSIGTSASERRSCKKIQSVLTTQTEGATLLYVHVPGCWCKTKSKTQIPRAPMVAACFCQVLQGQTMRQTVHDIIGLRCSW